MAEKPRGVRADNGSITDPVGVRIDDGSITDPVDADAPLLDMGEVAALVERMRAPDPKESERNFYVAIAAYGAAFGTGLFLLGDNTWFSGGWIYGAILTAGGGLGLMTVTPLFRPKLEALRSRRSLWAVVTMTWLFLAANVGFAIYDHFWPKAAVTINAGAAEKWAALTPSQAEALTKRVRFIPPENIMVACATVNCKELGDGIAEILGNIPGWKVTVIHHGGVFIDGFSGIVLNPINPTNQALRDAIQDTTGLAVTLGPDKGAADSQSMLIVGTRPF